MMKLGQMIDLQIRKVVGKSKESGLVEQSGNDTWMLEIECKSSIQVSTKSPICNQNPKRNESVTMRHSPSKEIWGEGQKKMIPKRKHTFQEANEMNCCSLM